MKLKRTSHFIGFKLDSEAFVDLYVRIQQFLDENNIAACVELQNILSLHTTLYYFEAEIPAKDKTGIEDFISTLQNDGQKYTISLNGFEYFRRESKEEILYLKPKNDSLPILHKQLATRFQRNGIVDDQYTFIPHITLLKIVDLLTFQKHRLQFEEIISQCLEEISSKDVCEGIHFFAAYSQGRPEIQIPR